MILSFNALHSIKENDPTRHCVCGVVALEFEKGTNTDSQQGAGICVWPGHTEAAREVKALHLATCGELGTPRVHRSPT